MHPHGQSEGKIGGKCLPGVGEGREKEEEKKEEKKMRPEKESFFFARASKALEEKKKKKVFCDSNFYCDSRLAATTPLP
jgi:hypothetical protein